LEVWAAAWSSPIDPDMYQVYHKDSKATSVKNWGYDEIVRGTDSKYAYERNIVVNQLAPLIEAARETTNETERAEYYADALDLVMELAVELPTYQRNDLIVYNQQVINKNTLNTNPSPTSGVFDRIWEVNYN
jgi:peptide/nickel transport system substrate-binding protein